MLGWVEMLGQDPRLEPAAGTVENLEPDSTPSYSSGPYIINSQSTTSIKNIIISSNLRIKLSMYNQ